MRILAAFSLVFFALALVGCPTPGSYIKASEMGLENAINLDKNVEILGENYFNFISKDTERLVAAGSMTKEARATVLKQAKESVANLKEQSIINKHFVNLAHDWVHSNGLKPEEILAMIKTVNEATPEVLKFIDKLKGE
jgi:hypothetical protein